ncbi:signal peptidase I [Phycicoccus avicenniae]|nr:signal peptidase I [Phycicoccus avicenniae]
MVRWAGAAVKEVALVLVMAMVLSFVVKTWFLQAFYIPSGSMEETLLVGDRVVVSKLTPGPFDLERGDVVVFEDPGDWLGGTPEPDPRSGIPGAVNDALVFVGLLPSESENHLIKRVVGLPGDRVVCCDEGRLTVNGARIEEPYVFPGDVPSSVTFDVTVPEGRIWVMGDHRSDSEDSRFHDPEGTGAEGSVPVDRVTGRAIAVVWPLPRLGWLSDFPATFSGVPSPTSAP